MTDTPCRPAGTALARGLWNHALWRSRGWARYLHPGNDGDPDGLAATVAKPVQLAVFRETLWAVLNGRNQGAASSV